MSMSDPVGDMLTRIRNGLRANHPSVKCPHSTFRASLCQRSVDITFDDRCSIAFMIRGII